MVDHSDEEIKKQLSTKLHLNLHCAASFEGVPCSDDESEVMSSKFGVIVGGIVVRKASRCQDGGTLDTRLEALFFESELFQFLQAVLISLTIDNRVF